MAAELGAIQWALPIAAFLLVFVVVFAIIKKSDVLGGNPFMLLLISFILASFFIVEASLVQFVQVTSSWFAVGVILVFFILAITAFMPGDKPLGILTKGNWLSILSIGALLVLFIVASSFVFNWSVNWTTVTDWAQTDTFGIIVLIVISLIVSFGIAKKTT